MDRDLNFSSPESLAVELDQARVSRVCHCVLNCGHAMNIIGQVISIFLFSQLGVAEAV